MIVSRLFFCFLFFSCPLNAMIYPFEIVRATQKEKKSKSPKSIALSKKKVLEKKWQEIELKDVGIISKKK